MNSIQSQRNLQPTIAPRTANRLAEAVVSLSPGEIDIIIDALHTWSSVGEDPKWIALANRLATYSRIGR
jgi:hypothetical protein